jgi:Flp pilus assembly protein TadD
VLFRSQEADALMHGVGPDRDGCLRQTVLAGLEAAAGRSDAALARARRAVELDPYEPSARARLAGVLLSRGDARGAEAAARRAVELEPGNGRYRDLLSRCR